MGEKTILLWKDPKYRKHMSEAHKGIIPPSRKGCIPWNKNLTKETDERVRKNAVALKGIKHLHKKESYPSRSRKELFSKPDYRKRCSEKQREWCRKNPKRAHEKAVKMGLASLESRKKNSPYKLLGLPFLSLGERKTARLLLNFGIVPEKGKTCHIRFGRNEYDFMLFNTVIIEYHPTGNFRDETAEEYYNRRIESLNKNGKEKLPLIVLKEPKDIIDIMKIMGIKSLQMMIGDLK